MKVRTLLDTCDSIVERVKITKYFKEVNQIVTLWQGGQSDDVPKELLKSKVLNWYVRAIPEEPTEYPIKDVQYVNFDLELEIELSRNT